MSFLKDCIFGPNTKAKIIKIDETNKTPIKLSLNQDTGSFDTKYDDIDWIRYIITENQYYALVSDLNKSCQPIHQNILINIRLLSKQSKNDQILDLCVALQQLCMKLQNEIEQTIYSHEYTFLKNNLQIINQIQYAKMKDILSDPGVIDIAAETTVATLFQLYKDGIIIQHIPTNSNENKSSSTSLKEGIISYNV